MGTTREASKVTTVFETVSVCGARVPVPLVAKAPEAPPTAQSVVLNWPVILRVSSLCHAPASSMLPPVQLRKRAGRGKNPFLFAMLFEKNIEIFSDPNPSVLCVFSICLPPFRAWTGGWRGAGSSQSDAMQNITGAIWDFPVTAPMTFLATSGAFTRPGSTESALLQSLYSSMNEIGYGDGVTLDVSRVVRTSTENRPVNVAVPTMLYLGIPA